MSSNSAQHLNVQMALKGTSAGQPARSSKKDQDESTQSGGTESGGAAYTTDFPDSTRGTALLSPPDPALDPIFIFEPKVGLEFPDLSEREFLAPTLNIGSRDSMSSRPGAKEDVYQRIEKRLRGYHAEAEKTRRMGLKQEKKSSDHGFENPSSRGAAATSGLEKKSSASGLTF
jgi:hypothetical protein